jgi:hypothetical protein
MLLLLAIIVAFRSVSCAVSKESPCENRWENVTILYSQGLWASRGQAAKYVRSGIMVNGGQVTYGQANDILRGTMVDYPELAQVSYEWTVNPLYMAMQFATYLKTWWYWSWNDTPYHVHIGQTDFAGPAEVAAHREAWLAHNKVLDGKQYVNRVKKSDGTLSEARKTLVMFGSSRGASTVFTSVAQSDRWDRRHLALVVLEAPFDSVENTLRKQYGEDVGMGVIFPYLVQGLTNYSTVYPSPIRSAWQFPLDVPVVFVTSAADTVVHPNQTKNLMDRLRTRGHPAVHHLELEQGEHSTMALGDGADQKHYARFMTEMYERYVLPPVEQSVPVTTGVSKECTTKDVVTDDEEDAE